MGGCVDGCRDGLGESVRRFSAFSMFSDRQCHAPIQIGIS